MTKVSVTIKIFLANVFIVFLFSNTACSQIKGKIIYSDSDIKVVKLWGTHQQRAYAYGYLCGSGMLDIYTNYIKPLFGGYYNAARNMITNGNDIVIDSIFHVEAQAMLDGLDAAGIAHPGFDKTDVLLANCFLDVFGFYDGENIGPGCSSLMNWGDATTNTALNGKSVISRHVDWDMNAALKRNQIIVVHIPEEADEQPWLLIGFAGQMSVLSGVNQSGNAAFMHAFSDCYTNATTGKKYKPIWFTMRKALEKKDFNNDLKNDVNDFRAAFEENKQGYAYASLVTCLSSSIHVEDSLIAMVAELAPAAPELTFRYNYDSDTIPGDNLYAANYGIKRNNAQHYCSRYWNIVNHLDSGTHITDEINWSLMRDYSNSGNRNIQFMQFVPENKMLKLSVANASGYAYQNTPYEFFTDTLFQIDNIGIQALSGNNNKVKMWYANQYLFVDAKSISGKVEKIILYNGLMQEVRKMANCGFSNPLQVHVGGLSKGAYFVKMLTAKEVYFHIVWVSE